MGALGIGLGLSLRGRRGGFDPVALFPGGTAGAFYQVGPGYAWQDVAGTVPAAAGDPVGLLVDRSGNGNHAVQANPAQRPILRQDAGGRCWLEFDGVDDFLRASFALAQPWERISALRQSGWTLARHLLGGAASNAGVLQQFGASANLRLFSGTASSVCNVEPTLGADEVISEVHDGAASGIAINNGAATVADYGSAASGGVTIGASSAGSSFGNIRLYALMMRGGPLAAATRTSVRGWMAARAGFTL